MCYCLLFNYIDLRNGLLLPFNLLDLDFEFFHLLRMRLMAHGVAYHGPKCI